MDESLQAPLQKLHVQQPDISECFPSMNPFDVYRIHLANGLSEVTGVQPKTIYPLLQRTTTLDKGDLLLPVPALRIKGERPDMLASRWADEFPESTLVSKPVVDGPFIRFYLKPAALVKRVLPAVLRNRNEWGSNPLLGLKDASDASKGRKRIVIEFSSPNIAKPFHQGHLRSTIIGGFLANLYKGAGWDVVRLNYLGDWGKQYGLLALGFKMFGDDTALEEDPIHHLYQIYVKINSLLADERKEIEQLEKDDKDTSKLRNECLDEQAREYFKAMCNNDPGAISMWKKFRELSIQRYKKSYTRLNIHFDEYAGESLVREESMKIAQKQLESKGLVEESQGAAIVDFSKHVPGKAGKALGKALIRKTDGTSLYLTRDVGALFERNDRYEFDQMIYVVATDQELHLKQLFKLIELTGNEDLRSRIAHVSFGLVLGMSTRRGTVVFLDDVLRDVGEKMHEVMRKNETKYAQVSDPERTADILGISSVMVQDMSGKRINNYRFNIDTMTSFEGDTGPYLQYSHARLCSILLKAAVPTSEIESANLDLLVEPHAIKVVRLIAQFPDTIQNTLKTLEPTTVLTYLFRLTHAINSSYDVLQVVGSERELMKARLALYDAAKSVINNGMRLLGLTPLDR
ncbi:putative Arginyl-tRNA synthetase, cytoplasmic [Trematosphaeria pertusa]|uniref:arginine--tRNA ligase n=1 Tax=Trematosphaeria pertusa TaxID=390896 RepID=A0A6A6IN27_9PLEO|nr:putative Arginyl-tRNA synthetase, cytoplasmic [Trematosphaeria pertusa]KAF2251649.1 putative Arginyl-tRNA synthetase, cytoplasmic [Trematosphaeria pertusa]